MIIKYATSVLCSRSQFPHLWPRKEDVVDQKRRSGSQADVLLGVVRADGVGQNVERRQVPFQALLGQVPVVRSRRSRTRPRRPRWCHHLFHFFFGAIGSSLTDSENATKLPGPHFPHRGKCGDNKLLFNRWHRFSPHRGCSEKGRAPIVAR